MQWQYDLCQGEPIIRDLPVGAEGGSTDILRGAVVARDGAITTAANRMFFQNADPTVIDDVVGVAEELYDASAHLSNDGTNSASAAATGITNYIKVIVNPLAVYLCEYSQNADDDTVNTSADSTGKVVTATFTTDREGDWIYITNVGATNAGQGNMFQIGASTSTTSVTAVTSYDDNLAGNGTSDTFIVISMPYVSLAAGGSLDLSTASGISGTQIRGLATAGTGAILVLQNWIRDAATGLSPLRVEKHSGKTFDASSTHLFASIQLMDHLALGGTIANQPLIT